MLTREHRLTSGRLFAPAIRAGRRAGTGTVVVHLHLQATDPGTPPLVGLVVSKAVGSAVVRNKVKRRLRHLVRERLPLLPDSGVLVLRALPASAAATYAQLGADLDRALRRALAR